MTEWFKGVRTKRLKNKRTSTVLMLIGLLLLAAALFFALYNIYDAKRAEEESAIVLPVLKSEIERAGEKEVFVNDSVDSVFADLNKAMTFIEIDGDRYVGILEIPSIDLTLPIMGEWSYNRLRTAPCLYTGSVYQDNMVIAGHNYARHFSPIKNLPEGTIVLFTDGENRIFEYEIAWVEVLDGTQVKDMVTGEWDMTLFTCTYGGKARYAVRCLRK